MFVSLSPVNVRNAERLSHVTLLLDLVRGLERVETKSLVLIPFYCVWGSLSSKTTCLHWEGTRYGRLLFSLSVIDWPQPMAIYSNTHSDTLLHNVTITCVHVKYSLLSSDSSTEGMLLFICVLRKWQVGLNSQLLPPVGDSFHCLSQGECKHARQLWGEAADNSTKALIDKENTVERGRDLGWRRTPSKRPTKIYPPKTILSTWV